MFPHRVVLLFFGALALSAQPIPGESKVEIENRYVRVLRTRLPPHGQTPLRDRAERVIVCLTPVHIRMVSAAGEAEELVKQAGEVAYFGPTADSEDNLANEPAEYVVIELKPERIHSAPVKLDPVKLDPEHHTVPLENARVRVLRTVLEPHIKSPVHDHPSYVVVYLTELHTRMRLADGRTVDNPRKPGEIAWRDAYQHQTENIGDHTAVEIQVEMK